MNPTAARAYAVAMHGAQRYGDHPYVHHLDAVVAVLEPFGAEAQTIGYLHDLVEDTDATVDDVRQRFGDLAAACVALLSDAPGATRKERKARTYATLALVSGPEELALLVKVADRLSNVRSCVADGLGDLWETYRGEQQAFKSAAFRAGQCDALWSALDALLEEAHRPIDGERTIPALQQRTVRVLGEPGAPAEGRLRTDTMAAEVPVSLVFNGIAHAVMMATPQDLEAFALGFALSEGILDDARDCFDIEARTLRAAEAGLPAGVDATEVALTISTRSFERLKGRRRNLSGRTGCGVCGVESFAGLDLDTPPVPARDWIDRVDLPTVLRAFDALPARQLLNAEAGAIHAAGWARLDGTLTEVFEDVGRHNALDKLIGALARAGRLGEPGFVVLTSRGSHELVRKCARMGIAALATISAPTAMGVRMAELAGVRFWGLCRAPRAVLYAPGLPSGAPPRA